MCQFLPQDVVRDFPTMNNQEIFYNTVKAVGDLSLINTFDQLKEIQTKIEKLDDQRETKENTLESLQRKEKRLENDKQIYEKRKTICDRRTLIDNAVKWERFKNLRKKVKETRDKERAMKTKIDKLESEIKPLQDQLGSYEAKVQTKRDEISAADEEYSSSCNKVENFEVSEHEDRLESLNDQIKYLSRQETDRINDKEKLSVEIRKLENYFRNTKLDPQIDTKISDLNQKKASFEVTLQRSMQQLSDHEYSQSNCQRDKERLMKSQEQIQNMKNMKMTVLQRENPDAYQGVKWLAENRHKFKAPVHDPIMLSLDVKNKNSARYVETHIGRADLEGFVCENPDDVNILTKQLRETMRLRKINAFHSNPDPPSKFAHPIPGEEMTKYSFVSYVSDMYSAPDAVHAYLCRQKGLHQVPVFKEENNLSGNLKHKFHNYYIGNQKFNTRVSKYSGELSTGMEDIGAREVRRLAAAVDSVELERIRGELETKEKQITANTNRISTTKRTIDSIRSEIEKLDVEINKLKAVKKDFQGKQSELDMMKKTVLQLEKPADDLDQSKAKLTREKCEIVRILSQLSKDHLDLVQASVQADQRRKLLHLSLQLLESDNSDHREKLATLRRELETTKASYDEITKVWEASKISLQETHSVAKKATGVLSDEVKIKPPAEWQERFNTLGSTDEATLMAMLDECDSDLRHMKKIPDQTIADIEELKERLESTRNEKNLLHAEIANKRHDAKKLKLKWINGVQDLVEKVNDKFGSMMADLGYNGQISLSQGANETDFSSYGIKIQVRFRNEEQMQELSKGTQSGGEKSVTTAVYMVII